VDLSPRFIAFSQGELTEFTPAHISGKATRKPCRPHEIPRANHGDLHRNQDPVRCLKCSLELYSSGFQPVKRKARGLALRKQRNPSQFFSAARPFIHEPST
jgi:hypothetical protein